jgi:hypothetical protein
MARNFPKIDGSFLKQTRRQRPGEVRSGGCNLQKNSVHSAGEVMYEQITAATAVVAAQRARDWCRRRSLLARADEKGWMVLTTS